MQLVRIVIGKLILFLNATFTPKSITRAPERQAAIDKETESLALYEFEACPFCVKVRRAMKRLNLRIELKDAQQPKISDELVKGGGELQVPCLRIAHPDGSVQWMYESSDIVSYLEKRFP